MAMVGQSPIFEGLGEGEVREALRFLDAHEEPFRKGDVILRGGEMTDRMGLVLSGQVSMVSNDMWGNRAVLEVAAEGELFAEAYALLGTEPLIADATASADCQVLFLRVGNLMEDFLREDSLAEDSLVEDSLVEDSLREGGQREMEGRKTRETRQLRAAGPSEGSEPPCMAWRGALLRNLLRISSKKEVMLSQRSFHTAPKSVRGRVLSYLNSVCLRKLSWEVDIPFDRQQMADYLNLDRTALSKELSRMQKEGILSFHKNHFTIFPSS